MHLNRFVRVGDHWEISVELSGEFTSGKSSFYQYV